MELFEITNNQRRTIIQYLDYYYVENKNTDMNKIGFRNLIEHMMDTTSHILK